MNEKRRSLRQRVLKAWQIAYGGGSIVIDCTIRNMATVMWHRGDLIGIRFGTEAELVAGGQRYASAPSHALTGE